MTNDTLHHDLGFLTRRELSVNSTISFVHLRFERLSPGAMSNINETNPAVLKAVLSFYASSHSEDYEKAVYSTLKKIEVICANDYSTMCRAFSKDALFDDNHSLINRHYDQSPGPHDSFVVSLVYGDAGDMCMYLNYAQLSNTCQSVVADFGVLKEKYQEEEANANGELDFGPVNVLYSFFATVAYATLLFCSNRDERRRRKMKEMRAVVTGIEADHALDAQGKSYFRDCLYQETVWYEGFYASD